MNIISAEPRVVDRPRRYNCEIEQRAKSCRAQMDVDLMAARSIRSIKAVTRARWRGAGKSGPAFPDFPGPCHEPALRRGIGQRDRRVEASGIEKPLAYSAGYELLDLAGWDAQPVDCSVRSLVISGRET